MNPLVSVIVPCYNQSQWLNETLESVCLQVYTHWECIIVDDGSLDNSVDVAKTWVEKDQRFSLVTQNNSGVSSARNNGIARSSGDYILPLDADDMISSQYLRLAMESFKADPCLKLVYCKAEKIGKETGPWHLPPFTLHNLAKRNIIFCSAIYKKQDWLEIGGYDPNMQEGYEDWEFWISLLKSQGKVKCLPHTGFYYRTKESSRQNDIAISEEKKLFDYLSIKHADFFVEQLGSFQKIQKRMDQIENEHLLEKKSEKFVLDLFLQTFFGFYIFKDRF